MKLISTLLTFLFLSSLAYGSQNYEDFTLKDYEYSWCGKIIYRGDGTYLSFERDEKVDLRLSSDFYSGLKDDELKAIKKLIKDRSLDDITLCLSLTATSYLNDSAGRYGGEYPEVAQIKGSPKFVKVIEKEKTLYNGKLSQLARMATEPYVFVRINYRGRNEAQEVDLAKYGWAYDDSREKWSLDGSTIIFLDETKLNGAFPVKSTAYGYNFEFYYNNRRSEATLRIEVKRTTQLAELDNNNYAISSVEIPINSLEAPIKFSDLFPKGKIEIVSYSNFLMSRFGSGSTSFYRGELFNWEE